MATAAKPDYWTGDTGALPGDMSVASSRTWFSGGARAAAVERIAAAATGV